jgi:hypothetical protein
VIERHLRFVPREGLKRGLSPILVW